MTWQVIHADCLEAMAAMDEASVDAIVTDPPYGLEFMGKEWDRFDNGWRRRQKEQSDDPEKDWGAHNRLSQHAPHLYVAGVAAQEWHHRWATAALRVLKPGGHLLAFGGTRTYHRLACAVEDAGFEIRDCLAWMYGSGFPKSLDVSKAIDAQQMSGKTNSRALADAHDQRPEDPAPLVGRRQYPVGESAWSRERAIEEGYKTEATTVRDSHRKSLPATPEAQRWQGWGTALKPAFEPIVLARKPLVGSVASNVQAYGVGALNIDGTRIGTSDEMHVPGPDRGSAWRLMEGREPAEREAFEQHAAGRWPANVVLDPEAAALLDEQTGELTSGANPTRRGADTARLAYGEFNGQEDANPQRGVDTGGASRFFYCPKADREERDRGLEHRRPVRDADRVVDDGPGGDNPRNRSNEPQRNAHPTVKPVELMRWLCRLITPPGGTVLDPFTGSGSTGIAALREGFNFVGIEREADYVEIARDRIIGDAPMFNVPAEVV